VENLSGGYPGYRNKSYKQMILFLNRYCRLLKFFPILIFINFSIEIACCQEITGSQKKYENIYLARTKQFNEFIGRFNYETDFNGNPIDSLFRKKISREKLLTSLFDLQDQRLTPQTKTYSKTYEKLRTSFINEITSGRLKLNKYSGDIIAEAKSQILFNGVPQKISIFLNQEIIGKGMVKWVILDVKGEMFNFLKTDTTLVRFISPSSNETDFINLRRAMEDIDYLQYYASGNFSLDMRSLFFYFVNAKMIKFEYVEEVHYHILDIPGWCIKVKEFNRDELNSGWLIYDLERNDKDNLQYLKGLK
jgi:hypothetical protein